MPTRVQTSLFPAGADTLAVEIDGKALDILKPFAVADDGIYPRTKEEVELEQVTALRALAFVLGKNFRAAQKAIKDDGTFSITFKVTWNREELPSSVRAIAKCSTTSTSDIELRCEESDE